MQLIVQMYQFHEFGVIWIFLLLAIFLDGRWKL